MRTAISSGPHQKGPLPGNDRHHEKMMTFKMMLLLLATWRTTVTAKTSWLLLEPGTRRRRMTKMLA